MKPRPTRTTPVSGTPVPPLFPPGDGRRTINLKTLQELTDIPMSTLREWIRHHKIPGAFQPEHEGRWFFRRTELERWWLEIQRRRG